MKAAIYNPYWDTLGGGERYTASFVRLLLDKGWNVDIFSNNNMSEDIRRRFGLDIKSANFIPFPKNYQQTTYQYSLVFWLSDGSLPVSFARRTVVHFQFPFKDVGGRTPLSFLKSRFYTFVVNSRFTKTFIDSEYRVKSRVIYPPIHSAGIGSGFKTNTILYVGRFSSLTQSKGHDVLIRSFRNLHYRIPGWKLILAGGTKVGTDKVELSALRDMADGLPVDFVFDPNLDQLARLFSQAKIFWTAAGYGIDEDKEPTRVEHFGISLVEAMSAGCVPVVVGAGGFREIIRSGEDGLLWGTTRQLEDYTLDLVKHPAKLKQFSSAAVKKSKIFNVSVFNQQFIQLLKL